MFVFNIMESFGDVMNMKDSIPGTICECFSDFIYNCRASCVPETDARTLAVL